MARASTIGPICLGHEPPDIYGGVCRDWQNTEAHSENPEWWITEDHHTFKVGDRLFDYYDCHWVIVVTEPEYNNLGWFDVHKEGHSNPKSTYSTNSVRVSKYPPQWYTGPNKEQNA